MKSNILFLSAVSILIGLFSFTAIAQTATAFEIKEDESSFNGGKLYLTVNGKKRKIVDNARDAWIVSKGKEVVYSVNEMTRGFEGEGESLFIYNVKTAKTRKIMAESSVVTGLTEVKLTNGSTAFLVSMGDGGLGGSYFAVVDPKRGEVLAEDFAELAEIKGDNITLNYYREEDWEAINENRPYLDQKSQDAFPQPTKVKPEKTANFDLKKVLKNKVIYNKTIEEYGKEYERTYTNFTIYQWRPNDKDGDKEYFLMKVGKEVPKTMSPLRKALEALFTEPTDYEKKDGWESAVFKMKFEGVVLKDGVATIKFSQPAEKNKMVSFAGKMFLESVTNTAKQFKSVREVKICEVGGAFPAFENIPQISKCSAN